MSQYFNFAKWQLDATVTLLFKLCDSKSLTKWTRTPPKPQDEELQASIARETTESELNDLRCRTAVLWHDDWLHADVRQLFDELLPSEDSVYLTREDWELRLKWSDLGNLGLF